MEIVFADDHLLVVDKPAGLLTVPGRIIKDSVLHRLRSGFPGVTVVHRLDLDTSGLLLFGLSGVATRELNRQFRERTITKEYQAVVYGSVGKDTFDIRLALRADPVNRPRQVVDRESGKEALTRASVMHRLADRTRIRLNPVTGRSHQLRVHMAAIGHPVLGCDLYAHDDALGMADRLMLHASRIGLNHPVTGVPVIFESQSPF